MGEFHWCQSKVGNSIKTMKRFLDKIEKTETCWIWKASCFSSGYGQFKVKKKNWRVHRFAYEFFVGKIPEGLTLDHICRNKKCVNPAHLEPVTFIENSRRVPKQQVCRRGHERIPGTRRCKICSSKFRPGRLPEKRRELYLKSKSLRTAGKTGHA